MAKRPPSPDSFSNRALFDRASDPVFVLNQRRRLRHANPAFERLVKQPLADLYNMPCVRDRRAPPLGQGLAPPPEVMAGLPAMARRPAPPARVGPPWWDIAYFPLAGEQGLLAIVGRIRVVGTAAVAKGRAIPEGLLQLRRRLAQRYTFAALAGDSPEMARVIEQARVARSNTAPLVLVGESGTGKFSLARAIHYQGVAAEKAMQRVDCPGLPPAALELLLFGETGLASPARVGTMLVREPAALPRDLQARLVEWLRSEHADGPRLIASCVREPADDVTAGRLLPELRMALDIQSIRLPPLRERLPDVPRLATAMLESAGVGSKPLAAEALEALTAYSWPGNLRELEEVMLAAAKNAGEGSIEVAHLPATVRGRPSAPAGPERKTFPLKETLREMQRRLILFALRRARGHKVEAARLLDISRSELWRRMGELGIGEDDWRQLPGKEAGGDEAPPDRGV
jgi:transcriptional regulator with PAS, ATPase and Fis domain